jgi:hypothetical protein|tara:strand:- start:516 stop:1178 length:663 start_codon:yes stop_codon:yes gene_type:complete
MADRSVASTQTLEQFRTTFNSLATDLGDIASITSASGTIASATDVVEAVTSLNTKVDSIVAGTSVFTGSIIFEGTTDDSFETTLAVEDPTADRTITIPNVTGTITINDATQTLTNKTLTSPTVSGLTLSDSSIIFEGSTADSFETTITVTDPTADRTITIPNVTGTVLTTGNSDSPATTTSSSDVDFLLVDDGGTMKKITTANSGLATNAFAIAQAVALG